MSSTITSAHGSDTAGEALRGGAPTPATDPVLRAHQVRRSFSMGSRSLEILHGIDLTLHAGELVALVGASGAGKSTLLHILGVLDRPDDGKLEVGGRDVWSLSTNERARLRNLEIGFVFQFYHLLPELNAVENTLLPAMIELSWLEYQRAKKKLRARAVDMLVHFGLADRLEHRPGELSGGERQRVAMARALLQNPKILLADEPTGNLDSSTGETVLELLFEEQRRRQLAMILVTHDSRLADRCGRVLMMEDGIVQADSAHPVPD